MVQFSRPSSALPLVAMQENVRAQLKTSRQIFEIIEGIAEVARRTDDETVRGSLERIMDDLLKTGTDLSDNATDVGNRIIDFAKSQGRKQEASEPA